MKNLELYIHIPFCVRKCNYCDFPSGPAKECEKEAYVEELCQKIRSWREKCSDYIVKTIFVGGGTPSILKPEQTEKIFTAIRESFLVAEDAEITTEMNPGTVTREKLSKYKELGINRLSIGLQTTNDDELKALGRIHTYKEFLETYQMAREEGFVNINIDLMSAIPHQTMESYEETLRKVLELNPEHISAYSLIIEEGTPFYDRYGCGEHEEELPDEDTERLMYVRTKELLEEKGYHRYEISNYAKEGYECKHNLGYWERVEYLGIGLHAASFFNHQRWNEGEEPVTLLLEEEIEEFMFLGLRMIKGISKSEFKKQFSFEINEYKSYGDVIDKAKGEGLLCEEGDYIRLTEKGIDVSNYVLSQFL